MSDIRYRVSSFDVPGSAGQALRGVISDPGTELHPCGNGTVPAADDEQFEFIKRVIDDCDYYVVIVAGRYGSMTSEGISFTEKEFDYAISKGDVQFLPFCTRT